MYTKELIFDTSIGAFYKNEIQSFGPTSPFVAAYAKVPGDRRATELVAVTDNNEEVVTDDAEEIVYISRNAIIQEPVRRTNLRYLTVLFPYITFSFYHDEEFRDWKTHNGVGLDAEAYILTGQAVLEDTQRKKQAPHITCHFENTEPTKQSSCVLQSRWDFADSVTTMKTATPVQVYRHVRDPSMYDNGFSVVSTKTKLMGRGRALSLLFRTEPYKDCRLYGWGVKFAGNNNV